MAMTSAGETKENLKSSAQDAAESARGMKEEAKQRLGDMASAFKKASHEVAEQLGEHGSQAYEKMSDMAQTTARRVEQEVKNAPLASIGIAFGLGLLLSAVWNRSR